LLSISFNEKLCFAPFGWLAKCPCAQVRDTVPSDLKFVMEDIAGEQNKAGITWWASAALGQGFKTL